MQHDLGPPDRDRLITYCGGRRSFRQPPLPRQQQQDAHMPTIKIFDVEKMAIIDLAGFDPQISFGEPSPEERRIRYLSAMASDPRRGERDLLVADAAIMTELHRLETPLQISAT